jgi:hypothetical protein
MPVAMGLYLAARAAARLPCVDLAILCGFSFPISEFGSYFSFFSLLFHRSISISLSTGPGRQEHPLLLISLSSRFGCFSFSFLSLVSFFFSWASHEQFMMTCICGFHFFSLFSFFYFLCTNTDIWNAFHLSRSSSMRRCCSFIYPDLPSCTCSESLFRDFFISFVSRPSTSLSSSFSILPPQLPPYWKVARARTCLYPHHLGSSTFLQQSYGSFSFRRLPRTGQRHIFCMMQPVIYHSYLQDLILSSRMFHYIRHCRLSPKSPPTSHRHRLRHVQRWQ